jgi:hypothetical protein
MRRNLFVFSVAVLCSSCDPIREISLLRSVPAPPTQSCIVEALRMEKTVKTAGVSKSGIVYGELVIPAHLEAPEAIPRVSVEAVRNDQGEPKIDFSLTWVGSRGSREYREYISNVLDELSDRTIERCGT